MSIAIVMFHPRSKPIPALWPKTRLVLVWIASKRRVAILVWFRSRFEVDHAARDINHSRSGSIAEGGGGGAFGEEALVGEGRWCCFDVENEAWEIVVVVIPHRETHFPRPNLMILLPQPFPIFGQIFTRSSFQPQPFTHTTLSTPLTRPPFRIKVWRLALNRFDPFACDSRSIDTDHVEERKFEKASEGFVGDERRTIEVPPSKTPWTVPSGEDVRVVVRRGGGVGRKIERRSDPLNPFIREFAIHRVEE